MSRAGRPHYAFRQPHYVEYYNDRHWSKADNRYVDEVKRLPPHLAHYDKTTTNRENRLKTIEKAREKRLLRQKDANSRWAAWFIAQEEQRYNRQWSSQVKRMAYNRIAAEERLRKTRATKAFWIRQKIAAQKRLALTRKRNYERKQAALRATRKPAYTFVPRKK